MRRSPRFQFLTQILSTIAATLAVFASAQAVEIPRDWRMGPDDVVVMSKPASTTDTVPASNNAVDLIYAPPDLWAATSKGVSRVTLPGDEWTSYDSSDGLGANEIPSLAVFPNGVWTATSHSEVREGRPIRFGDGIFRFNDLTDRWDERSPDSGQASGPFQLAYDLAEYRGRLLASCFAGGLVASDDEGETWDNIFADNTARLDFVNKQFNDLNNRYFAVVADTTVPESIAVWAGTAYGLNKYVYLTETLKPTGLRFNDVFIDGTRLYAATESGLSVTTNRGGSWRTFTAAADGLPSNNVFSVAAKGDTIFAGFVSEDGLSGLGLAYSYNAGQDWETSQPAQTVGGGKRPRSIEIGTPPTAGFGDPSTVVWVAAEQGGTIATSITSPNWALITPTPSYVVLTGYIGLDWYIGTDVGVLDVYQGAGDFLWIDTLSITNPGGTANTRVIGLGVQTTPCTTFTSALWALTEENGAGSVNGFAITTDGGANWTVSSRRLGVRDVVFEGCRFWLATDSGLAEGQIENLDSLMFTAAYKQLVTNNRVGSIPLSLASEIGQDGSGNPIISALWVGTDSLLARSLDKGLSWAVVFSNPSSTEFDLLEFFRYRDEDTVVTGFEQLSGNFITALAYQPGGRGSIWAATQATGQGRYANIFTGSNEKDGISVTRNAGKNWTVPITGHQVWNFAFDGQIVWAASTQGILRSPNNGVTWDTLNNFVDPVSGAVVDSNVEVFAIEIVGNEVWAGTENGYVILDRNGNTLAVRRVVTPVVASDPGGEGGAYATPVPFSPNITAGGLRFHYVPPTSGPVTIRIYDYANNLVKTVTDGVQREEGQQYDEADLWDGRNGEGDRVAVGTYFFVIEYSGGTTHWGKLVVIP